MPHFGSSGSWPKIAFIVFTFPTWGDQVAFDQQWILAWGCARVTQWPIQGKPEDSGWKQNWLGRGWKKSAVEFSASKSAVWLWERERYIYIWCVCIYIYIFMIYLAAQVQLNRGGKELLLRHCGSFCSWNGWHTPERQTKYPVLPLVKAENHQVVYLCVLDALTDVTDGFARFFFRCERIWCQHIWRTPSTKINSLVADHALLQPCILHVVSHFVFGGNGRSPRISINWCSNHLIGILGIGGPFAHSCMVCF